MEQAQVSPNTEKTDNKELLELYKLHAEFVDRVSQRREAANRLYASLLTGIFIFLAAFIRFGAGENTSLEIPDGVVVSSGGALGIALAVLWGMVINYYRQLNQGKFVAMADLEEKLEYQFFKHEWNALRDRQKIKYHWGLSFIEMGLPAVFGIFFVILIVVFWVY